MPSRLNNPTLPMNGEDVEHANTDKPPFELFLSKGEIFLRESELGGFNFGWKEVGDLERIGL